jgi:hypothetical protein
MTTDQVQWQVDVPQEMRPGVYSDGAMVWHTKDGFTIDFLAPSMPPQTTPEGQAVQPAMVVARVRLPVGVIFQVARAISENVANYESQFGEIGLGGPEHPPEEAEA